MSQVLAHQMSGDNTYKYQGITYMC